MRTPVPFVRAPYPDDLRQKSQSFLVASLHLIRSLGLSSSLIRQLMHRYPDHALQAVGAAALLSADPADLFAANLCYDLLLGTGNMGCSTMVLAQPDGPLLARNMDWYPAEQIAQASCIVEETYGFNAGFIGMVGSVTALSRHGFALCLNAISGHSDPNGYPMLLFLRHVLDTATTYDDALNLVASERLMTGGMITLVGRSNRQRAVVERTPRSAAIRTASADEPLLATNHYQALGAGESCSRLLHLTRVAGKEDPLDTLTHPEVLQSITAQHILIQPATDRFEMSVPTHLLTSTTQGQPNLADLLALFQ